MKNEIIDFIKERHLGSSDVADAINKINYLPDVLPVSPGCYAVGEVEFLYGWCGSIYTTHMDLEKVSPNKILFIQNIHCSGLSLLGDLMATYAFSRRKAIAIVVNGRIRDLSKIRNYPIWATGVSPIVCSKNASCIYEPEIAEYRNMYQNSVMVCDDDGCVCIEQDSINEDTFKSLIDVAKREESRYQQLRDGKSTFEIVCK